MSNDNFLLSIRASLKKANTNKNDLQHSVIIQENQDEKTDENYIENKTRKLTIADRAKAMTITTNLNKQDNTNLKKNTSKFNTNLNREKVFPKFNVSKDDNIIKNEDVNNDKSINNEKKNENNKIDESNKKIEENNSHIINDDNKMENNIDMNLNINEILNTQKKTPPVQQIEKKIQSESFKSHIKMFENNESIKALFLRFGKKEMQKEEKKEEKEKIEEKKEEIKEPINEPIKEEKKEEIKEEKKEEINEPIKEEKKEEIKEVIKEPIK